MKSDLKLRIICNLLFSGEKCSCCGGAESAGLSTCNLAKCGKTQEDLNTVDQVFIAFKNDCTTVHFEDPKGDGPERYSVTFDSTETETIVEIRRKRTLSDRIKARSAKRKKMDTKLIEVKREPIDEKDKAKLVTVTEKQKRSEDNVMQKNSSDDKGSNELETDVAKRKKVDDNFTKVKKFPPNEKNKAELMETADENQRKVKEKSAKVQKESSNERCEVGLENSLDKYKKVKENFKKIQKDAASKKDNVELEIILEKDGLSTKSAKEMSKSTGNGNGKPSEKRPKETVRRCNPFSRSVEEDDNALRDVIEILDDECVEPDVLPVITNAYSLKNHLRLLKSRRK